MTLTLRSFSNAKAIRTCLLHDRSRNRSAERYGLRSPNRRCRRRRKPKKAMSSGRAPLNSPRRHSGLTVRLLLGRAPLDPHGRASAIMRDPGRWPCLIQEHVLGHMQDSRLVLVPDECASDAAYDGEVAGLNRRLGYFASTICVAFSLPTCSVTRKPSAGRSMSANIASPLPSTTGETAKCSSSIRPACRY